MVRFLAIVVAGVFSGMSLAPATAVAESGEEMRARGEQLAKDGRFSEAIDAFKAAEKIEPRARHACLIALAYIRRELWPQAEIFLEECQTRATAADPVPEWLPQAKQQLAERLAAVNVAPITIRVEPAGVDVRLAVSSFAPDELFAPRTIHLPPGHHVIIATAAGYNDAQKTIDVAAKAPQLVTITMLPEGVVTPGGGGGGTVGGVVAAPAPAPASRVPTYVGIAGGTILGIAVVNHAVFYRKARDTLADARTPQQYQEATPAWERSRKVTLALYGAGAATVATALILKLTVFKREERPTSIALEPRDGGGMLTLGWSR